MAISGGKETRSANLVLVALMAPVLAGAFVTAGWAWGWNHLHQAGPVVSVLLLAGGAALGLPRVGARVGPLFEASGRALERAPARLPILLGLLGLSVFSAFPIATRLYGDSKVIIDDHTPQHLAVYIQRMFSFGVMQRGSATFALHDVLSRLTGLSFEKTFMLVSVLCGGIFLYALASLAARIPSVPGWARAAIIWIGVTDGANQMFFGHVESYVVPRLFMGLFLIEVVRSLLMEPARQSTAARVRTALWFILAVVSHLQAIVLLPTLLMWMARPLASTRPFLRPWAGRKAAAIGIGAMILCLVAAYSLFGSYCYDYIYTGGRPHPRQLFIPITTHCVGQPYLRYTMFSSAHILDFFGSIYSISSPAILLVIITFLPRAWKDDRAFVLLPSIVAAVLHDFVMNTAIGYPFDWDLMSVLSPPLLLTAVFLLAREPLNLPRRGFTTSLLFLGLGTAVVFGVNASRERAYHRVEEMGIWLHKTYYGGSHYRLSANLSAIADAERQIAERQRVAERIAPQAYPDDREVAFLWERLALKRIEIQMYEDALERVPPRTEDRAVPLGPVETGRLSRKRGRGRGRGGSTSIGLRGEGSKRSRGVAFSRRRAGPARARGACGQGVDPLSRARSAGSGSSAGSR